MNSKITIQELDELFSEASQLTGQARMEFLDRACAGRPRQLRSQLDRMLDMSEDFLSESLLHQSLNQDQDLKCAGRWKLEEKIGEGGLGVVYRATAVADGVSIEAAVKVLRPGMNTGLFHERFQKERQILAALEHPGIARLMECGAEAGGRSYLAMEYVSGKDLEDHLLQNDLSRSAKVALAESVVRAVEYLHSRLVVHGDIKPGNVMVTGSGATKLLDFGAARLLDNRDSSSGLTKLMLTPHYASPEQKNGAGPSVASDIYSLGRLLEEVLGAETDPDLKAIVEKCQAREPGERYSSASSLAEDLVRWRTGYPVHARRLTMLYATVRFLRRRWAVAGLSAALAVALGTNWWTARRAAENASLLVAEATRQEELARRSAAESERRRIEGDHARQAASESAERFRSLLNQALASDPGMQTGYWGELNRALERSYQEIIRQMEASGATEEQLATMWRRFGGLLCLRGDFRQGVPALNRALVIAERAKARESTASSRNLEISLHLYVANIMWKANNVELAQKHSAAALRLVGELPAAERRAVEKNKLLQVARVVAADAAPPSERAALLQTALNNAGFDSANLWVRYSILERLIVLNHQQGQREALAPLCQEAERLLFRSPPIVGSCGLRPVAQAGLGLIAFSLALLNEDPDSHFVRFRLAQAYLNLARVLRMGGDETNGSYAVDLADMAVREAEATDPDSPGVRGLRDEINLFRKRGAAGKQR